VYLRLALAARHTMAILACDYASIVYRKDPPSDWIRKHDKHGNLVDAYPPPEPDDSDEVKEEMAPRKKRKMSKPSK
jgi:hypothetical protein